MKRTAAALFAAVLLSACCGNDVYDFQPEDKDKTCGVVTYNDPTNAKREGDVPIGRYCATESGKR